jgi:DNA-binding IclR family transcriptional regulator
MTAAQLGVAAVDRALLILSALASAPEPSSLAQLARATGLYKSTMLRIIASLEAAGYVIRLRDGRYCVGASAYRLGLAYERQNAFRDQVLSVLRDLVDNGTESASFHVLHGAQTRMCLFRVNSRHSTLDRVDAGDILPLDRGAAGRVLLAYSGTPGARHEALRREGYAHSKGERDPECAALAAPIFGPTGDIVGALSLSGPGERFTPTTIARMRKHLMRSASELTRSLGGIVPKPLPAPPKARTIGNEGRMRASALRVNVVGKERSV